jgi:hypothetical protein
MQQLLLRACRVSSRRPHQKQWRFHKQGMGADGRAITTCSYHKPAVYYSRTLAVSGRRSMLFSGGDFPRTLSSILSGEGFDESEQGNRRFSFFYPARRNYDNFISGRSPA